MSQSQSTAPVGARAARVLTAEFGRRPGGKTGLLVDATPDSEVLAAAIDALLPEDRLTIVCDDPAGMQTHLATLGSWVQERVRVADSLEVADPADVVILAEPVTGTAEQVRTTLDGLAKLLAPGAVVSVAVVALPGAIAEAAAELDRQAMLYGVGSDLVLRNLPPLRIHRLRWTPADSALAERLTPVTRPSSIPLTRTMHLDSNGAAAAGIALGLAALTKLTRRRSRLWLLPAVAAVPIAAFFRDPERDVPEDDSLVVAASDGKVLSVERVTDDRFSDDGAKVDYLRIAVFLSLLDAHVNRAPVAGQVVDYFVEDGGYAPAMNPEGEHNVTAYTVLQTSRGRMAVAQRTGLLARRIVQRAPVGALLARGERFGLIRFGSRTDIYLPAAAAEPLVAPDDRVLAGSTPVARWRTQSTGPDSK
ncbi:MAG TPA: phosphatidylserine decarboxylase [Natronosporangium sp.]